MSTSLASDIDFWQKVQNGNAYKYHYGDTLMNQKYQPDSGQVWHITHLCYKQ
jgi:hypothetical protein